MRFRVWVASLGSWEARLLAARIFGYYALVEAIQIMSPIYGGRFAGVTQLVQLFTTFHAAFIAKDDVTKCVQGMGMMCSPVTFVNGIIPEWNRSVLSRTYSFATSC